MKRARAWLCCLAWCLAWCVGPAGWAASDADGEHPLLDLAQELAADDDQRWVSEFDAPDLRSAEHALAQAHPPPDEQCARSIGAPVFAELHAEVARAQSARGDFAAAAQAYRHALACTPRSTRLLHNLALTLFQLRDLQGAREFVLRALDIDPRSARIAALAANIDFVSRQWTEAISRFRYAAASESDRTRAAYWQLMYWLAQLHAGAAEPTFVERRHVEGWPRPLMLYLQGQYSEAELAYAVREGSREYADVGQSERLCEALFYVGEAYLARQETALARAFLAAAVNVKMTGLDEHALALAEIARMQ